MEALNSIRFWRPNNDGHKENRAKPSCGNNSSSTEAPKGLIVSDHEFDEGDDSFFDLELPWMKEEQSRSLSPNDNFSKRKIIPIEATSKPQFPMTLFKSATSKPQSPMTLLKSATSKPQSPMTLLKSATSKPQSPMTLLKSATSKPQSPMTLLKSAPKFRVFTLRKSKSMANTSTITTYIADKPELTPKHSRVTFQIQDSPTTKGKKTEESLKDVMQKYFNKLNPLYVKVSKNQTKISGDLTMSMKEKQGNICKQLGNSRSASATSSPLNKRDDSLLLRHDGIQSAILHCKKSLNSPREPCRLSRCTSDSSQEKLSNASSSQEKLSNASSSQEKLSNASSSYEKLMDSARISSEERNVSHHLMY